MSKIQLLEKKLKSLKKGTPVKINCKRNPYNKKVGDVISAETINSVYVDIDNTQVKVYCEDIEII